MRLFHILPVSTALFLAVRSDETDPLLPENSVGSDCPLAGPAYPAPSRLSESAVFRDAVSQLNVQIADPSSALEVNDTAWAIALFSAKENKTLYEQYYTPSINVSVPEVNIDSIFRLASVTKVFTAWTFLALLGDDRFNDPITKYIPELTAQCSDVNTLYSDIDNVRWEEVTIGELASHASGITRDVNLDDLSSNYPLEALESAGLPAINENKIPRCDGNLTQPPCSRKEFFNLLLQQTPIWPTSHSPAYSNIAYNLLAYALESITGKTLETAMTETIFRPLNMTHSSYSTPPPIRDAVIPGDLLESGWGRDIGADSAGGGAYMSTRDLITAGQAILQSTLLTPAQTRRWFKPMIQTGYLGAAVGAPWEITYLESPNNRLVQYYTKDGDLNAYHTTLVLSPEHEVGFFVLAAGTTTSNATLIRSMLKVLVGELLMPAVEEQAKIEAGLKFNGTYIHQETNSSVTIASGYNGHSGLTVLSLISNGVPILGPGLSPGEILSSAGVGNNIRLYSTTLKSTARASNGDIYDSRLGFRAALKPYLLNDSVQDPCILNWGSLNGVMYGNRGFDDWVFDISEDGNATSVDIRFLRVKLHRQT